MYSQISTNKRKSVFLMVLVTMLVVVLAYTIQYVYGFGNEMVVFALGFSIISNLAAYYAGDKIALAMNGAREVAKEDNPYVYRMVENLCITAGMPVPKVYVIDDSAINAFATGRDPQHAVIAVTTGAIEALENEELEGVLAHELSHVQNYDIRFMTIVVVLIGTLSILADFALRMSWGSRDDNREKGNGILAIIGLVFIILAPIVGELIKLAVSRKREYLADASGALLTRYPEGLARALEKIAMQNQGPMANANHATAHLFLSNPFGESAAGFFARIFSTHPPVEDRIAELRKMA